MFRNRVEGTLSSDHRPFVRAIPVDNGPIELEWNRVAAADFKINTEDVARKFRDGASQVKGAVVWEKL